VSHASEMVDHHPLHCTEGFRIEGIDAGDELGYAVNTAGDINGDGYDDIIIGASGAASKKGDSYVIFSGYFTGDSTVMGTSGEDLLRDTHSLNYSTSEFRGNPLTPGDAVNTSSESRDPCIGTIVLVSSYHGDLSDLFALYDFSDIENNEDE